MSYLSGRKVGPLAGQSSGPLDPYAIAPAYAVFSGIEDPYLRQLLGLADDPADPRSEGWPTLPGAPPPLPATPSSIGALTVPIDYSADQGVRSRSSRSAYEPDFAEANVQGPEILQWRLAGALRRQAHEARIRIETPLYANPRTLRSLDFSEADFNRSDLQQAQLHDALQRRASDFRNAMARAGIPVHTDILHTISDIGREVENLPVEWVNAILDIPKRAIQSAEVYTAGGGLDPSPFADTALLLAGTRFAGGPARTAHTLGVGGVSDLLPGPDVPPARAQFDLFRYNPPRGVSNRVSDAIADPMVRQGFIDAARNGQVPGLRWHNTEPLRRAHVDVLGDDLGNESFEKYADFAGATSVRSRMPENIRNASFFYQKWIKGEEMPEVGDANEPPYGAFAQRAHQRLANDVALGGIDSIINPKPPSLGENLKGNQRPVAFDSNNMRLLGILSRNPEFLKTSVDIGDGVIKYPQQMFYDKTLPMDEAAKHPEYWDDAPRANEYAALEDFMQNISDEMGVTPAQARTSAYI